MVEKVMTISSGKFPFNNAFDRSSIVSALEVVKAHYQAVKGIPILPEMASSLNEELIRRSIFGTAAIEGNPLDERQVEMLVNDPVPPATSKQAEVEIYNLKSAYEHIDISRLSIPAPVLLDEDHIKRLNTLITGNAGYQDHEPGMYRDHVARVGDKAHGGKYTPPKNKKDIQALMEKFIEWINSPEVLEEDPFIRAILTHYHLAAIHPFGQGNGRTARLLEAEILSKAGIKYLPSMLSNYYYDNIDNYYTAFREAQQQKDNDMTPFILFCVRGLTESAKVLRDKVHDYTRIVVINHFIDVRLRTKDLTIRQHDLLKMLFSSGSPATFTLKQMLTEPPFVSLYRKVSEATARRDLKKLEEMRLLEKTGKHYCINLNALG